MASSAFNPDDAKTRSPEQEESGFSPPHSAGGSLFEDVLRETLALASEDRSLKRPELDALIAVARRHAGAAVSLDVVVELIQTVLHLRFQSLAKTRELALRMSRDIASTMRDDPQTWQRIESFWARLAEAVR